MQCQSVSALGVSFLAAETICGCMTKFKDRVKRMKLRGCNLIALLLPASAQIHCSIPNAQTSKCEAILVLQSRYLLDLYPIHSTSTMGFVWVTSSHVLNLCVSQTTSTSDLRPHRHHAITLAKTCSIAKSTSVRQVAMPDGAQS